MEPTTGRPMYILGNELTNDGRRIKSLDDNSVRVSTVAETIDPDRNTARHQQFVLESFTVNGVAVPGIYYIASNIDRSSTFGVDRRNGDLVSISPGDGDAFIITEIEGLPNRYTIELYDKYISMGTGLLLSINTLNDDSQLVVKALEAGRPPKQKWIFAQMTTP